MDLAGKTRKCLILSCAPTQDQDREAKPAPPEVAGPGAALARRQGGRIRAAAARAEEARKLLSPEAAAKVPRLLDAARRGDVWAMEDVIIGRHPAPLDATDPDSLRTPLMVAADAGHEAMVEWLLGRGVDVNVKDTGGCTALMLAAGRGSMEVVRLLLAAPGQRLNARDYSGWTALMHAAAFQQRPVVEALLAGGADRDVRTDVGETAEDLTTCPVIKGLLRVSPPPPFPQSDEHARTHLHPLSITYSRHPPSPRNRRPSRWVGVAQDSDTLTVAATTLPPEMASGDSLRLTLSVCSPQTPGRDPAPAAASGVGGVARRDGKAAKKPNLGDKLRAAAGKGQRKTVKALLSGPHPPPIDARDPATQRTPLMEAAQLGHYNLIQSLVARGADVNTRDSEGFTPLMLAARSSSAVHPDKAFLTVTALFSQKHNSPLPTLDAQDAEGFTALMHAASRNHKRMVDLLLSHNAKRDIKDKERKTAWDLTTCPKIKALLKVGHDRRPCMTRAHLHSGISWSVCSSLVSWCGSAGPGARAFRRRRIPFRPRPRSTSEHDGEGAGHVSLVPAPQHAYDRDDADADAGVMRVVAARKARAQ
jgi:ankyrin repeat protein